MKEILGIAAMFLIFSLSGFICEAAEGKVTAETAYIRAEANTTSEVIGSTVKGKTVDIVGAVKDASGTVWYKVPNGNNTYGYIRSDLIETSETIEISENTAASTASNNSGESTAKPAETVPTPIEEKQAAVSVESAVVRTGASTQHDAIVSLPRGTGVTLVGEASDGSNKWYQITSEYNGRTVKGYVRSDLVTIGAPASAGGGENNGTESNPDGDASGDGNAEGENGGEQAGGETEGGGEGTEGEGSEQPEAPSEPEHNDYEVVYDDETYWLYDNVNGTMMPVTNLLQVVNQANENSASLQSQIKNGKIIIIVLAVIIVLLVAGVTVLLFKLRDAYYYEEEYEEEEEEEEAEIPVEPRKKKRPVVEESSEEEVPPTGKKKVRESGAAPEEERPERNRTSQDAELQAAEKKQTGKKPSQRKAQNFLVDDDEFEFEFLNMDDKDL